MSRGRHRGLKRRVWLLALVVVVAASSVVAFAVRTDEASDASYDAPTHSQSPQAPTPTPPGSTQHARRLPTPHPIPGYLLIADRGNDRAILVGSDKRVLWTYPKPGVTPAMPFFFDDDTFFNIRHDRIVSNQEEQQTIEVISFPGGRLLWHYGHVGVRAFGAGFLDTPDDAYFRPDGTISVADVGNCRVIFISPARRVVRQIGTTRRCGHQPPTLLSSPNGDTPLPNGGTLVTEINGSWVDGIGPKGNLVFAVQAPVRYPSDAQWLGHGRILLADYSDPGHVLVMTTKGKVLWQYGPASGPGALNHPSLALRLPNGLIAVNDDFRHRVVLISPKLGRIVWQYGHTDRPGTGPGFLNTPDGMDFLPFRVAMRTPAIRRVVLPEGGQPPAGAGGVRVAPAGFSLPAPVQRVVAVGSGGTVYLAGGLDSAGASARGVFALDPATGHLTSLGNLPDPTHDAAGAVLGNRLAVFGGGSSTSTDTVQAFDLSSDTGSVIGHLPTALSDLSAATVGGTTYLVGGYDGTSPQPAIYATTDGTTFREAGRLPVGLRYAAVATVGADLVIAGGITASGPSSAVYRFDTTTRRVSTLGTLPAAIGHASAVVIRGKVLVIGGQDAAGSPVATVTSIDPATGRVTPLAPLARPVSDAAAVSLGRTALVIGGLRGTAVADVLIVRAS